MRDTIPIKGHDVGLKDSFHRQCRGLRCEVFCHSQGRTKMYLGLEVLAMPHARYLQAHSHHPEIQIQDL